MSNEYIFPELPIEEWEETNNTLHLFLQIIGKIRLKTFPKMNHWWHVPFYLSPRGITTHPIPYKDLQFEMSFDFIDHLFVIISSGGHVKRFPLHDGLSVSEFHNRVFEELNELGIYPKILAVPYDMPAISREPFKTDSALILVPGVIIMWSIQFQKITSSNCTGTRIGTEYKYPLQEQHC